MKRTWQRLKQHAMATPLLVSALGAVLAFLPLAGSAQQPTPSAAQGTKASAPAPKRDLTGIWHLVGTGGSEGIAPDKMIPPMTAWGQALFDAEKPGYGPRRAPGGNDPIFHCDPMGFPRVLFLNTPYEFVQTPKRILQFFEHEHEYRSIWMDGRSLPKDADPSWYGYAVGRWIDDYTLEVDSNGYNDKTWLGATGYPHSDQMRLTGRYHRIDHDTMAYDLTITDPKTYTKPLVIPQRRWKLREQDELIEEICVPSEEMFFEEHVAAPATPKSSP